jgi:hypothetical protein
MWGQIRETTSKTSTTQGKRENFEKTTTQGKGERREYILAEVLSLEMEPTHVSWSFLCTNPNCQFCQLDFGDSGSRKSRAIWNGASVAGALALTAAKKGQCARCGQSEGNHGEAEDAGVEEASRP